MYEKKSSKLPDTHRDLPAIPRYCQSCDRVGDTNETTVATAVVDRFGKRMAGRGSDFTGRDGQLADGVTFVRWITRCAACYQQEYDSHKAQS